MLPQKSNLLDMSFSYNGQPFIQTVAKPSIVLNTMEYSDKGRPFITNGDTTSTPVDTSSFFHFALNMI